MTERSDIVILAYKRVESLRAEAKRLGFCRASRDMRVQAEAIREFALDLVGGKHLEEFDDRWQKDEA